MVKANFALSDLHLSKYLYSGQVKVELFTSLEADIFKLNANPIAALEFTWFNEMNFWMK